VTGVRPVIPAFCALVLCVCLAGCAATAPKSSYSVDSNGILSVTCAPVSTTQDILFSNVTYTKTRILMQTQSGDVVLYLAAPEHPLAAVVYAPGAGERVAAHEERMARYAAAGYAFAFVDLRGNGGETPGDPFNPQADFGRFEQGRWPQFYETVCDMSAARGILGERFGVPVYAAGSSNGGRYAAVAAALDPQFAGYIGISTSGFSMSGEKYSGDARRFLLSIDPDNYISSISPRPVWVFHSRADSIIPFDDGRELFGRAKDPRIFTEFYGGHGINSEVDERIIAQWAQIYGTRG
jgi:pimeloyl-ACP methyl ester carboxylesterase